MGTPRGGFRGEVLSSELGVCGAARFGAGAWEGGMLRRSGHGAPWASAEPWRERGLWGTRCGWLSPRKVFQPEASDTRSWRPHPAVAIPGSGAVCAGGWAGARRPHPAPGSAPSSPAAASPHSAGSAVPNPAPAALAVEGRGAGEAARRVRVVGDVGQGLAFVTPGKVVMVRRRCCLC